MQIICYFVTFFACTIGRICGMGGGVIIKPVLDSTGLYEVAVINCLSGCAVIGMSSWSIWKFVDKKGSRIQLDVTIPLAIGAVIGGIVGKKAYESIEGLFVDSNTAGGIQAALLFLAVLATLIYTANQRRFATLHTSNKLACVSIGAGLGMLGTFLGIGGGPFNMAALFFFFSMTPKDATQNSLFIILISQMAGLLSTIQSGILFTIPASLICGMVLCGIIGGEIGGRINRHISEDTVTLLLNASMVLVMLICIYNVGKYLA
ncbi:MAG: sulfite exporter TauE/SafE family protein [Eubacteriales bacterium]|nr:sulfite exporter TauE/SafE family protein [Eubacteriales bacterium]